MTDNPLSKEFFEAKYQQQADPWDFAGSRYENDRYAAIVRTLGERRFRYAFEPGCSVGVLTARLAAICDRVFAMDIAPTAVAAARVRCRDYPGVEIREGTLPQDLPGETFDLVMLSEIGYYFDRSTLAALASRLATTLAPNGTLLAAHWLGQSPDHILRGDEIHELLQDVLDLPLVTSQRYEGFRIDMWRCR